MLGICKKLSCIHKYTQSVLGIRWLCAEKIPTSHTELYQWGSLQTWLKKIFRDIPVYMQEKTPTSSFDKVNTWICVLCYTCPNLSLDLHWTFKIYFSWYSTGPGCWHYMQSSVKAEWYCQERTTHKPWLLQYFRPSTDSGQLRIEEIVFEHTK